MKKTSFEEQYPGYPLIPDKRPKWLTPAIYAVCILTAGWLVYATLDKLGSFDAPPVKMAGDNSQTKKTVKNFAHMQSAKGDHAEAVKNFSRYFAMGGDDAESMAAYATSLSAIGEKALALQWSRKAVDTNPQSRAARFINETLESTK